MMSHNNTRTLELLSASADSYSTVELNDGSEYIKVDNKFSKGTNGEICLPKSQITIPKVMTARTSH